MLCSVLPEALSAMPCFRVVVSRETMWQRGYERAATLLPLVLSVVRTSSAVGGVLLVVLATILPLHGSGWFLFLSRNDNQPCISSSVSFFSSYRICVSFIFT